MPKKVRVFISSTIEDLTNERQSVVKQIKDIGLEPINAEGILPNGGTSWDVLADEIASSHIFVLILGDRYGWIPTTGHGAGSGKSVTHLEFEHARAHGLPILPFQKRLKYNTKKNSADARKRDAFRRDIAEWKEGQFRTDFELAIDLGEMVRSALLDVFQDTFLKRQVQKIELAKVDNPAAATTMANLVPTQQKRRELVLFAGAGFSVAAGYPTASSLAEVIGQRVGLKKTGPEILSRHSFADLATYAEDKLGNLGMIKIVQELLDTALPVEPTKAHFQAIQYFRAIFTTNYDLLFEQACETAGVQYRVVRPSDNYECDRSVLEIYKVDGSIDEPESLVLTHNDIEESLSKAAMWKNISALLESFGLVVVGHSLRGSTGHNILSKRNNHLPGYFVSPFLDELDTLTLSRYNLEGIRATADDFMESLSKAVCR